ncbi:MAG: hypothetical protein AAFV71_26325 [Cyanobacteria bacterium J06633_8]
MQIKFFKTQYHHLISFCGLLLVGIFLAATDYYFTVIIVFLTILVFDICFTFNKMDASLYTRKQKNIKIKWIDLINVSFLILLKLIAIVAISHLLYELIKIILNSIDSDTIELIYFISSFSPLILMILISLKSVYKKNMAMRKKNHKNRHDSDIFW